MQKAEKKVSLILTKFNETIKNGQFCQLDVTKKLGLGENHFSFEEKYKKRVFGVILALVGLFLLFLNSESNSKCVLEMPIDSTKAFRKAENCVMCKDFTQVTHVKNISPQEFEDLYAHTGVPVIVTDGTKNWTASDVFSFKFFKSLYDRTDLDNRQDDCQFFPYKTEFKSLGEVFNMSVERSRLEPGTKPWYVGWSNCNDYAGKMLRLHYKRPYFLPENSENIALSWIFLGGPGYGAHMHVDNVVYPSWQAQLSGNKQWKLMPPPECLYQCYKVSATVHPGEIIVLDTNLWYHQTNVLEGDISITIGSEFD